MSSVFFTIVCPLFGCIIANFMFAAPLPAVLAAQKNGTLGELNPVPFVAAYVNCIGYTSYGILRMDWYMFFANMPGLCLAVYFTLVSIKLLAKSSDENDATKLNILLGGLIFGFFFWSWMGMIASVAVNERFLAATIIGSTACVFSILYYTAPLSTVLEVIRVKDASSFYAPMIAVNFINAMLWLLYGFIAINQPAVYVPNMLGALLSIFQLSLIVYFGQGRNKANGHVELKDEYSPTASKGHAFEEDGVGEVIANPILGEEDVVCV